MLNDLHAFATTRLPRVPPLLQCASSKWFVAPLPKGGPPNLYWAQRKARVAAEQAAAKARGRG